MFSSSLQILRHSCTAMFASAAGCFNRVISVFSDTSFALALVSDTKFLKMVTFVDQDGHEFLQRLVDQGNWNIIAANGWGKGNGGYFE